MTEPPDYSIPFTGPIVMSLPLPQGGTVTLPDFSKCTDPYLAKLRSMNDADLAEELSEEKAVQYRGLLHKALLKIQAFQDPMGNPPEDTGEHRELKEVGDEIEAALTRLTGITKCVNYGMDWHPSDPETP